MYAIRLDVDPRLQTNTALREYARAEYGRDEVAWFLAAAAAAGRKTARRSRSRRWTIHRARPLPRGVACKGSPHRPSADAPSPA